MSKIGDLFIKLGLKKQDFDKGIDEAENQVKGFSLSTKAMATAAAAAWAAVAAAVVKFAKDAVKMTQTWGDQWNVTMAGVKGAYSAFVRQLASGEGFDNLFANMREAARVARETAKALDEVFERTVSGDYRTAQIDSQVADWEKVLRDVSQKDQWEHAAAEIKRLQSEKYGILMDINKQDTQAKKDILKSQTGLNDYWTDYFTLNYNANREAIQKAQAYLDQIAEARKDAASTSLSGSEGLKAADAAVDQIERSTDLQTKIVARALKLYNKSNDEIVKAYADAATNQVKLESQMKHATDMADRKLGRLAADDTGSTGTVITKQAEESVDSLKVLEEALDRADRKRKALMESHEDVVPVTVDVFGIDADMEAIDEELDAATESIQEHYEMLNQQREQWADLMQGFRDAIVDGFADACEELMNQLMGLKDFNPGAVVQSLLTPLAEMAEKAGAIIMAEGFATLAAKSALETFGATGWGAVAAGAALIAAGAAAKAGLAALAKGGSSGASATTYGGSGGGGTTTQDIQTELTITVEGRISGGDIVLAGQKTLNSWNR